MARKKYLITDRNHPNYNINDQIEPVQLKSFIGFEKTVSRTDVSIN